MHKTGDDKICDVLVVGSGFLGISSALLLAKQGVRVALIDPSPSPVSHLSSSLQMFWPSLNDPFTRPYAAHGYEMAVGLNRFCERGVDLFSTFLKQDLLKTAPLFLSLNPTRHGLKDFEREELQQAKQLYQEGLQGFFCTDPQAFQNGAQEALHTAGVSLFCGRVLSLQEGQNQCVVTGEDSEKKPIRITSQIVVLACGALDIVRLLPRYASILVPMSDGLFEYDCVFEHAPCASQKAFAMRLSNGHIALTGYWKNPTHLVLKITGPRFLLPQAGVGVDLCQNPCSQDVCDKVKTYHKSVLFPFIEQTQQLPSLAQAVCQRVTWGVDCLPCDELPLVGEFGKWGRILSATGFLATGFSAGIMSGKVLCDLILQQKSEDHLPLLSPRRFFRQ